MSLESDLEDALKPIAAGALNSAVRRRVNSARMLMGSAGAVKCYALGSTEVPRRSPS